jgi:hypothetical protein
LGIAFVMFWRFKCREFSKRQHQKLMITADPRCTHSHAAPNHHRHTTTTASSTAVNVQRTLKDSGSPAATYASLNTPTAVNTLITSADPNGTPRAESFQSFVVPPSLTSPLLSAVDSNQKD